MTTLLQELSKKAAERWATVILGPGLLFVACLVIARHQGFDQALDLPYLRQYATGLSTETAHRQTAGLAVIIALGAAAAGLATAAVGKFVEQAWMPTGPQWYVGTLTRWRIFRWDRTGSALTAAIAGAGEQLARDRLLDVTPDRRFPATARLHGRQARLSESRPDQPTWMAQRMADTTMRVQQKYGLDLAQVWPHTWALADSDTRKDIQTLRDNHAAAGRLTAWGTAYLALSVGTARWPAGLLAAALLITARYRARSAIDALAMLVGSTVDLYIRRVAEQLGVPCQDAFSATTAASVNAILGHDTSSD